MIQKLPRRLLAAASLATALFVGACAGGETTGQPSTGEQTIVWWHNSNAEPGKGYYDKVARDFETQHSGVKVEVHAMQHEDMVTKLEAAWQSGDMPDVYMERGGGELAGKVKAGLVRDLTDEAKEEIAKVGGKAAGWQVDGRTYGLPYSVGVVGFWYNTKLFEQAGITKTPQNWDEMFQVVDKLKATGIDPISVGAGDKWPAAHYWYYFVLRECSKDVLTDAVTSLDFHDPCFLKAGEDLAKAVQAEPFNPGFLTTLAQAGPTSASGLLATGKVAMELAGHWEPGVMQGLTEDNQGLGENTGWFAFPAVPGGKGDPSATLGGGDAWAVPKSAPDVAVDFAKFLLSDEVQIGFAEKDMGLPTNPAATNSVKDRALADLLRIRDEAAYVQLYFDTAFGQSIGGAMNDSIALVFAGQATAKDIVDATQAAADAEK